MSNDLHGLEDAVNDLWEIHGQCYACDSYGVVNDLQLCEECAGKLERDLICQRDWDYSAAAYGLSKEDREDLRQQVIVQYGEALELIAPPEEHQKKSASKRQRHRRSKARSKKRS